MRIPLIVLIMMDLLLLNACSKHENFNAQGYIEGRYTYIATNVSGILKVLRVERGAKVKKGQALYLLEQQPESDEYLAAKQNLQERNGERDAIAANLAYAKITYERYKTLVPKNAIQQSELDRVRAGYFANLAQLSQANSNIESAKATLAKAKWMLDQKSGYAPVDALVFDTFYRIGEYTEANKAVLSLLAPQDIKAIFYIQEIDLSKIKLNQKISVHCDNCRQPIFGRVSFISPTAEYTPPVIYSEKTSAKLVFRIEAAFDKNVAYELHPGQPVIVDYHE